MVGKLNSRDGIPLLSIEVFLKYGRHSQQLFFTKPAQSVITDVDNTRNLIFFIHNEVINSWISKQGFITVPECKKKWWRHETLLKYADDDKDWSPCRRVEPEYTIDFLKILNIKFFLEGEVIYFSWI